MMKTMNTSKQSAQEANSEKTNVSESFAQKKVADRMQETTADRTAAGETIIQETIADKTNAKEIAIEKKGTISPRQKDFLKQYKKRTYFIAASRTLLFLGFLLLWEGCARAELINDFIFSSPSRMFFCFLSSVKERALFYHIAVTIGETFLSFLIVSVVSLCSAALLWSNNTIYEILEPALVMLNSLPKSALAPVLIVWLGNDIKTVVVTGVLLAVFASTITLTSGFYKTDTEKILLMQTLGANKKDILLKLLIPSSIPLILSSMKVNIGLCLVGVIIGEFMAAKAGLGYLIIYSSQVFEMDMVMLSILILCVIAVLMYQSVSILCKKVA